MSYVDLDRNADMHNAARLGELAKMNMRLDQGMDIHWKNPTWAVSSAAPRRA